MSVIGQALRAGTDLWAWHVFSILRVLGVLPSRFFAELFWPDDAGPYRADLVHVLEALLGAFPSPGESEPPAGRKKVVTSLCGDLSTLDLRNGAS